MPQCLKSVIVSHDKYTGFAQSLEAKGTLVYYVSESILASICDSKTPQGIAAIASLPEHKEMYSGFIVMLDDVQDPQNTGTIIRTADAAGCSCVVLSPDSADCYSPKAVRASMGSIFHIPVIKADIDSYIRRLVSDGYQAACAHLEGDVSYTLDWSKTCLVIGNESRGVSPRIKELCTKLIKIPMYGKAQSLNAAVAAGILIYKIRT